MTEDVKALDPIPEANTEEPVVESVVAEAVEPEQNNFGPSAQNSTIKNTESVLALVFGILSLLSSGLFAIPALIFASKAKNFVLNSTEKSMATAGKILGIMSLVILGLVFLFYFVFFFIGFATGLTGSVPMDVMV